MNTIKLILIPCLLLTTALLKCQGINEYIAKSYLRNGNAQSYAGPLIDVLGASMQSVSLSYMQPDSTRKFHIYIGVYATAAFIPQSMKNFKAIAPNPLYPNPDITVPTIFGENTNNTYYDEQGNGYTFPGGFEITQMNLAFPIIHVGTLFHTNFSGRYFSLNVDGDLKRIEIFGIGLNHFISDYWKAENYFVSVGGSLNQYKIGNYMKGKHIMIQATGGQHINKFNYWGFLQWNQSPYEFYYEDEENGPGTVSIDGESNFRLGAGCGIKLSVLYLQAEASGFKPLIASLGIGLQF